MPRPVLIATRIAAALVVVLCLSGLASPPAALAGTTEGMGWLLTQQYADGSFGNTAGSLATDIQSTAEVLRAYQLLDQNNQPTYTSALAFLNNNIQADTETLSRKILVGTKAGTDVNALVDMLMRRQNSDGGFADGVGNGSSILDTAFALQALAAANYISSSQITTAIAFLLKQQQAAGGWIDGDNNPSVYPASQAVKALWSYRNSHVGVNEALGKARNFLFSRQDANGAWGEDFNTASTLNALIPHIADLSVITAGMLSLQAAQLADGSWDEDAYTTALTLQALKLHQLRQSALQTRNGSISGYVVKSGSTEPIADAALTLRESPGISVRSNADGYFIFTGLPTGTYTITANKSGYITASLAAGAQPNQLTLAGNIMLAVADSTGLVKGKIFDAANQLPLSGVWVSLGEYSTTTNTRGEFDFGALPAGSYAISIAKNDYDALNGATTLAAGQALIISQGLIKTSALADTDPAQGTNPAPISATVTDAQSGLPIAGALCDLGDGLFAGTDINGQFTIATVPRGNHLATLSANGYMAQTYAISFPAGAAGNLGVLSLYPAVSASAPTTLALHGLVVNGVTGARIAGASATLIETGAVATTGTDGRFILDGITLKNFTLNLGAADYQSAATSIQTTAFGTAAATFALSPPPDEATLADSTLQGTVTNASTGEPVVDATVQIVGTQFTTTTDAAGRYRLSGIDLLRFALSVSAVGYAELGQAIQLATHGKYLFNPVLAPVVADSFMITSIRGPQTAAAANSTALFTVSVASLLPAATSVLIIGEVTDPNGNVVAKVTPYAEGTTISMAEFLLGANEVKTLTVPWNTVRFPPGTYRLVIRLVEPGTISAASPWGRTWAEGAAYANIVETRAIGGAMALDPPLTQAGLPTPVQMTALIANAGNTALAAGSYQLTVSHPDTGAILHTIEAGAGAIDVGQHRAVDFGTWVPTASGNLALSITARTAGVGGTITDKLYVGDKASGTFTVNKPVVPDGTQKVRGKISMQGVDVSTGSSTDPLFKLVQEAVEKGGQYVAPAAVDWHKTNRCLGCHIQTQSYVGLSASMDKAGIDPQATRFLYNSIASSLSYGGSIRIAFPEHTKTQTYLGMWALGAAPNKQESFRTKYKATKFIHDVRHAGGLTTQWSADHISGWWQSNDTNTALAIGAYADVLQSAGQVDLSQVHEFALDAGKNLNPATVPFDMEAGPDGALYIVKNGAIDRFDPATGTVTTVATGITGQAHGLAFAADGTLHFTNGVALRRMNPNGSHQVVASAGSGSQFVDVETGPDGRLYVADYGANVVRRYDPTNGQWEVFLSGGLLSTPYGLAFHANGDLLVSNFNGYNVLRVTPAREVSVYADGLAFKPLLMTLAADGYLYVSTYQPAPEGLARISPQGVAERLIAGPELRGVATMGNKLYVTARDFNKVHEILVTPMNTALLANYRNEVPYAVRFLLGNRDNNPDNIIQAWRLIGLAYARPVVSDPALLTQINNTISSIDALLRTRQRADGGWGRYTSSASDPLATATMGLALEYRDPSPDDPRIRKIIQYLLDTQKADGSWAGNSELLATSLAATSFVMTYLPRALERLGGIDIDLHLELPATVTLGNPSMPPTATLPLANGGTGYTWSLLGVTSTGRNVEFDLTLHNMQPNEIRPVATKTWLEFDNSFVAETVRLDLAVPEVSAPATMTLAVATDKNIYQANEPVTIASTVANIGAATGTGTVQLMIRTPDGATPLVEFAPIPVANLATGAQQTYTTPWNTGTTFAGNYEVYARLHNASGRLLSEKIVPFTIAAPNALAVASITTDKPTYNAWDKVVMNGLVRNVAQNAILPASRLKITVTGPAGDTRHTDTHSLNELVSGGLVKVPFSMRLSDAPAGSYRVLLILNDSVTGVLRATAETTFQVVRTVFSAISATAAVQHPQVYEGAPNRCTFVTTNAGAAAVTGMVLRAELLPLGGGAPLASRNESVDLAGGGSHALLFDVPATLSQGSYACRLQAVIGNEVRDLAAVGFEVLRPPVILGGTVAAAAAQVHRRDPQTCTYTVSNTGAGTAESLTVERHLIAPNGTVLEMHLSTITLAGNTSQSFVQNYATLNLVEGNYSCRLKTVWNNESKTQAEATWELLPPVCPTPQPAPVVLDGRDDLDLIVNGSFEEYGPLNHDVTGTFHIIPGWEAKYGPLEIQTTAIDGIPQKDGNARLELDSTNNAEVSQWVPTDVEGRYELLLAYSPRVAVPGIDSNNVEIWWDGQHVKTLSGDVRGWRQERIEVTTGKTLTQLTLKATGSSDKLGGLIDQVRLYCIACRRANLIYNGSFERHPRLAAANSGTFTAIPGWQALTAEPFEVQHDGAHAVNVLDGHAQLELDTQTNAHAAQNVATAPGKQYGLSLFYAPRVPLPHQIDSNQVEVWWAGRQIDTLRGDKNEWYMKRYSLVAGGTTSRLEFRGAGAGDTFGGVIDNVQLSCPVPFGPNLVAANFTASGVQNIATETGRRYQLGFRYSPQEKPPAGATNVVEVWWGTQLLATLSGNRAGWQEKTFTVDAAGNDTRLAFIATGRSDGPSALIDSVALVAHPLLPGITSTPVVTAIAGEPWSYTLVTANIAAEELHLMLEQAPAGVSLDGDGVLRWATPIRGEYPVRLRIDDGCGGTSVQSFTLTVAWPSWCPLP